MSDDCSRNLTPRSWFLMRPVQAMMSLPVEYRWEFTRRHPYYQQFWDRAARFHQSPSDDPLERLAEEVAVQVLGVIGYSRSMVPISPQLGPDALGTSDLGAAWAGGAVAPATFRALAGMLLVALPAAQRSQLGRLLTESAEYESRDSLQMAGIYTRLTQFHHTEWDVYPEVPVLSINLEMPQRAITEAVEQLVRQWKQDRGILERRRRDDSLDDYLAVWDLREGWQDGAYSGRREKTLRTISQEIGIPLATATSRYRSAFRLLSGHDYTPELWIRLMGRIKLSQILDRADAGLLLRRPWRSPHPRPVTESVLLPGRNERERAEFLEAAAVTQPEIAMVDLALDVQTLLDRGLSDEEVLQELELEGEDYEVFVAELRSRRESR